MNLADLSIKRPIFVTCLVLLSLIAGLMSMSRLGVDLFPDVTFPVVVVTTPYPGAGPSEIETLVSKPIEDEISTLAGIKRLSSNNQEGISQVIAEFTLETDVKFAEQQIRDRVGATKRKLPEDIKEPIIRRIDPADQPIVTIALRSTLPPAQLYDLAEEKIKPRLDQVNKVGLVEILGGRKREIQVALDREKLKSRELSASLISSRLAGAGEDIPSGKKAEGDQETIFRTVGQFRSLQDIKNLVVNFFGNESPVRIGDVGQVIDTLQDESSRTYLNENTSLFLNVFRQSGANTVAVADGIKKRAEEINIDLACAAPEMTAADCALLRAGTGSQVKIPEGTPKLVVVRDASVWIRANILDVQESIFIGIVLAVAVVFLFLANGRSTIITGLALPNSLIGAFILMAIAGFSINIMSLLALSLSVGLLIDDAIVVRENIFRHLEMGKTPKQAALDGTGEVRLAVIATTLTVIAVFGPLGFLKGVTGQFFKQFGLTICFAMAISLFDALTIAPMLSAYFAGSEEKRKVGIRAFPTFSMLPQTQWWHAFSAPALSLLRYLGMMLWSFLSLITYPLRWLVDRAVQRFSRFQDHLDNFYERFLRLVLKRPLVSLFLSVVISFAMISTVKWVPKTFLPAQDAGEFNVALDLPPGTNLEHMSQVALEVSKLIGTHKEAEVRALTVGSRDGDSNAATIYVHLVPAKQRPGVSTGDFKDLLREELKKFAYANPKVKDFDGVGGGMRPFNINIYGTDQKELEELGLKIFEKARLHKGLLDADISFRPGKPEFQVQPDKSRAQMLGVSTASIGTELRNQVEGVVAAKYRETGIEYDIRVRLQDDQRNLKEGFNRTYVPNMNNSLVRLSDVAKPVSTSGPSKITRQDRNRYVQISADIAAGAGLGEIMTDLTKMLQDDFKLPNNRFAFVGQAENFKELGESMMFAIGAGVLFIFLVLASLYESFVTPFTIMLALPLALCGSFVALLMTGESLNIFSMIGVIMLLGVATKNSILLVDYAHQLTESGLSRADAIVKAGRTRLRPILMTTMALIAGTIPIAMGLNEASKQRTSMGVAIVGGLISSTILTLIVVPAAYSYVDRFRVWSSSRLARIFIPKSHTASHVSPLPRSGSATAGAHSPREENV